MLSTRKSSGRPSGARGPAGKRCYAVGDVHGRIDLLKDVLEQIMLHDASRRPLETAVVLLGDLIDRGPGSNEVVEFVRRFQSDRFRLFVLMGNHEELMLRSVDGDLDAFHAWMTHGGLATMRSYGVDTKRLAGLELEDFRQRVADALPHSHISFLRSAADSIRFGDYLLVHAGIVPGKTIDQQRARDLRWIRGPFLASDADHGFVVVHGHSQRTEIEVKPNRIGIDTGAYHSGILTAAWFEEGERGFIQTAGPRSDAHADISFE